jgi:DNA-binding response OmpR family regulator
MPDKSILLVEDEHEVAHVLGMGLRAAQYDVDVADTAARARDRLNARHYDLVVADWRLPDGSGIDIVSIAAVAGSKTLLMSAYLLQIPADQVKQHELLMKPMRPSELVEAVKRLIG